MKKTTDLEYRKVLRENFGWFFFGIAIVAVLYSLILLPASTSIGFFIVGLFEKVILALESKFVWLASLCLTLVT